MTTTTPIVFCLITIITTNYLFHTTNGKENFISEVSYTIKENDKPAITKSFTTTADDTDEAMKMIEKMDENTKQLRNERHSLMNNANDFFAKQDKFAEEVNNDIINSLTASTSSLLSDEFMGGDKLFEEFFPGALSHHHPHHHHKQIGSGMFTSLMNSMENAFSLGLRHGRERMHKQWDSKDHAHKPHSQCCCKDIHQFCSHIKADGTPVSYYKIMKCLADRQRIHHDIHPICVKRLSKTVAGNCAETIDRTCSNVIPGNNA